MERKIRHLEMIQQIINRMANNSLSIKGWVVAIITAGSILDKNKDSFLSLFIYIFLIFCFSLFDSKYLQYERKYRKLYEIVRKTNEIDFSMNINIVQIKELKECCFCKCYFSLSIVFPYLSIIIYSILLYFI